MSDTCSACGMIGVFILVLGIIASYITMIVYDIIALKTNAISEINDKCPESAMWYYILVTLIMTGLSIIVNAGKTEEQKKESGSASAGILGLVMMIWGAIELWDVKCAGDLKGMLIYTMTEIHTIVGIVVFGLGFLVGCGLMCGICMKGNR